MKLDEYFKDDKCLRSIIENRDGELYEEAKSFMKELISNPSNALEMYSINGKCECKAIISLTSWTKRINTALYAIYSLLKQGNYKVVLTLSNEEFKDKQVPKYFKVLEEYCNFEILWCDKNIKAFKKFAYAMLKYDLPIISADDDCIYINKCFDKVYDKWMNNKNSIVRLWNNKFYHKNGKAYHDNSMYRNKGYNELKCMYGPCTLYPNNKEFAKAILDRLTNEILEIGDDDTYYGIIAKDMNINVTHIIEGQTHPCVFFSQGCAMNNVKCGYDPFFAMKEKMIKLDFFF